jgi:hypothetical protein
MDNNNSIDSRLVDALSVFDLDVERSVYTGQNKKYFVFNYTTIPDDFSDDAPEHERYLIQVHLFAPPFEKNINPMVKSIKIALYNAGFMFPEVLDESDSNGRHIVFETEDAEGIDYGEL